MRWGVGGRIYKPFLPFFATSLFSSTLSTKISMFQIEKHGCTWSMFSALFSSLQNRRHYQGMSVSRSRRFTHYQNLDTLRSMISLLLSSCLLVFKYIKTAPDGFHVLRLSPSGNAEPTDPCLSSEHCDLRGIKVAFTRRNVGARALCWPGIKIATAHE
jgi:hypothetical protein